MDFLGQCTKSHLDHEQLRVKARVKVSELYDRYATWCKQNGEKHVLTSRKFGAKLSPMGFQLHEANGIRYRLGLELKAQNQTTSDNDDSETPGS
jgi:phage/plasmid-associated DNA primase